MKTAFKRDFCLSRQHLSGNYTYWILRKRSLTIHCCMQATVVTVLPVNNTMSVAAGRRLDSFLLCGFFDVL